MKREHIVSSAGYWFRAARYHQDKGELSEALMCMENAYNHVENALAAALHKRETFWSKLRELWAIRARVKSLK